MKAGIWLGEQQAQKGPPHIAQTEVITSEALISTCKNLRLKSNVSFPQSTASTKCVHVVLAVWLWEQFRKDRGQSASTDEF